MGLKAYTIFFRHVSASGIHLHDPGSSVLRFDHTLPPPITVNSTPIHTELEAAKHGIVYLTLPGEGNIGTLVNGAGLAMNTCDVINARGGSPANFLDTGGKATGRTVVEGLKIVLADERVSLPQLGEQSNPCQQTTAEPSLQRGINIEKELSNQNFVGESGVCQYFRRTYGLRDDCGWYPHGI
jgi:hypothetical protein